MSEKLRKVRFSQMKWEVAFDENEQRHVDELAREREGYFHCWTDYVDSTGDLPIVKKMALIEEVETGKILKVDYHFIQFLDTLDHV